MRIYAPPGTRSFPSDRNPARILAGTVVTVNGGVTQDVAAYTVPAGRRAVITTINGYAIVTTVLAAGQTVQVLAHQEVPGTTIFASRRSVPAAAVGATVQFENVTAFGIAGDVIKFQCAVSAGAGVVEAGGGLTGVEYDV